jgi:hypothetical protein
MYELIISRYQEPLSWIAHIPEEIKVVIYNKGEEITDPSVIGRSNAIIQRPNQGREAETYIYHILCQYNQLSGRLIFCQGYPFEHSPNFIELLQTRHLWSEIQPLSVIWKKSHNIPPHELIENRRYNPSVPSKIRKENFSLYTWCPIEFIDDGAIRIGDLYRAKYNLKASENIASHFLMKCGLQELSGAAENAKIGSFCYGAIFSVEARLAKNIPLDCWKQTHDAALTETVGPYIFERLWLHLFGEPFLLLQADSASLVDC